MFNVFQHHDREFAHNRYVYPVVSRRSRGISIGVDLTHERCTFRCVYCSELFKREGERVNAQELLASEHRDKALAKHIDLELLEKELTHMIGLTQTGELFKIPPFDKTPTAFRRLNDIALSGSGEPTLSPDFDRVCQLIRDVSERGKTCGIWPEPKTVLITNGTALHLQRVQTGLAALGSMLETWAKLDAGTEAHFQTMNCSLIPLESVLKNLLFEGSRRSMFIQTLVGMDGKAPEEGGAKVAMDKAEIEAWIGRLKWLLASGAQLKGVQIYTVARTPKGGDVLPVSDGFLRDLAHQVASETGVNASWYGSSGAMGDEVGHSDTPNGGCGGGVA